MSDFKTFLRIREEYAKILPGWMAQYEATGDMRQDPYFMNWQFTPIERDVWSDIRTLGVPFYPQMPVLNYFIDFGNPFMKIGIECDGKAWHDYELDKARDKRLADAGWMIFRIEGHKCRRVIEPWSECEEDNLGAIEEYFLNTSEGIVSAIKRRYFENRDYGKYEQFIEETLFQHRSTPETYPVLRPVVHSKEPVLIGDALQDYINILLHRMRAAA